MSEKTERALIPYYYLSAFPYPTAGSYKEKKQDEKEEVKLFVEDFNSAAIQHHYFNSPAYPYLSAAKYPKKKEPEKNTETIDEIIDKLLEL